MVNWGDRCDSLGGLVHLVLGVVPAVTYLLLCVVCGIEITLTSGGATSNPDTWLTHMIFAATFVVSMIYYYAMMKTACLLIETIVSWVV